VRATTKDKTTVYFNQIYATATVDQKSRSNRAKASRGGWGYNRNVSPRMFLNTFNDYEYDEFQSLDLRFVLGARAGLFRDLSRK